MMHYDKGTGMNLDEMSKKTLRLFAEHLLHREGMLKKHIEHLEIQLEEIAMVCHRAKEDDLSFTWTQDNEELMALERVLVIKDDEE